MRVMNGVSLLGASTKGEEGGNCALHLLNPGKMKTESKEALSSENRLFVQQGKCHFCLLLL